MARRRNRALYREQRLSLSDASKYFASRPTRRTIIGWCLVGFRTRDNRTVVLESFKEGRTRVTTREACDRFSEQITENGKEIPVRPPLG